MFKIFQSIKGNLSLNLSKGIIGRYGNGNFKKSFHQQPFTSSSSSNWKTKTIATLGMGITAASAYTYTNMENLETEEDSIQSGMSLARRNSLRKQKRYYPYVIVGAGTTAHAAIEAIRQYEPTVDILVLSDEPALPRLDVTGEEELIRPELMDSYNEWRRHITSKLENEPDAYSTSPITLRLGKKDMYFDVEKNRILLEDGSEVQYNQCLIASAGKPRQFYVLDSKKISYALKDRINTCTTLQDFEQLNFITKRDEIMNLTVVGGGFLGTEVTATLASIPNKKVQQIFVESNPMDRHLPDYLSINIRERLEHLGVEMISDRLVTGIKSANNSRNSCVNSPNVNENKNTLNRALSERRHLIALNEKLDEEANENETLVMSLLGEKKEKLNTDYVVLCSTHIDPNVKIAKESCLEIDGKNGGIVVNAQLEAVSGLFVAGNAASYYDPALGRRRVDRYDHAVNSGLLAGQNMVAKSKKSNGNLSGSTSFHPRLYTHQPMFRSSLPSIGILMEGVGEINSNLSTVGFWLRNPKSTKEKHEGSNQDRGVVYYLRGGHIVGILLWNASDLLESARRLLQHPPEGILPADLKNAISIGPHEWIEEIVCEKKSNGMDN